MTKRKGSNKDKKIVKNKNAVKATLVEVIPEVTSIPKLISLEDMPLAFRFKIPVDAKFKVPTPPTTLRPVNLPQPFRLARLLKL